MFSNQLNDAIQAHELLRMGSVLDFVHDTRCGGYHHAGFCLSQFNLLSKLQNTGFFQSVEFTKLGHRRIIFSSN